MSDAPRRRHARHVARVQKSLADAAQALVALDDAHRATRGLAREKSPTGIPGADELLGLLDRGLALPAPVEGLEAAHALLAAISAADALADALDDAPAPLAARPSSRAAPKRTRAPKGRAR